MYSGAITINAFKSNKNNKNLIKEIEKLCQTEIEQGEYSQFTDAMSRCMEDMWKASAGAEIAILFAIPILLIGLIIFWIGWRIKLK